MRRAGSGDRSARRRTSLLHTPARAHTRHTQPHTPKTLARARPPPAPTWVPPAAGVLGGGRGEEGAAAAAPPSDAAGPREGRRARR